VTAGWTFGEEETLRSCTFESQIRKSAAETFAGAEEEWREKATVALRATGDERRRRRRWDSKRRRRCLLFPRKSIASGFFFSAFA